MKNSVVDITIATVDTYQIIKTLKDVSVFSLTENIFPTELGRIKKTLDISIRIFDLKQKEMVNSIIVDISKTYQTKTDTEITIGDMAKFKGMATSAIVRRDIVLKRASRWKFWEKDIIATELFLRLQS